MNGRDASPSSAAGVRMKIQQKGTKVTKGGRIIFGQQVFSDFVNFVSFC